MLSSDKNVESIAQLVESVKSYVGLQGEYLKLDVIQKIVRLVTALSLTVRYCLPVLPLIRLRLLARAANGHCTGVLHSSPLLPCTTYPRLRQPTVVD